MESKKGPHIRVGLVGPPQSGKSTLFCAIVEAGGSAVHTERPDQPHLAVVKVPDERLDWLAELAGPKKLTYAELEFLDIPGLDLSDEPGRHHARTFWPAMRQCDMLAFVVRSFASETVPAYRGRIDPAGDAQELLAEMQFADLDQVTARADKLTASLRKPTGHREQERHELELMQRLAQALEADRPIAEAIKSDAEAKLLRSFAMLSQKPVLAVLNCGEQAATEPGPGELAGLTCIQLSAEIEKELAELSAADRGEFLADLGIETAAAERMIRACYQRMDLVSFFTINPNEGRAWAAPAGADALRAAGQIHSDIARGFIRAETVAFADLKAAGNFKAAKAAGKVRLEGKSYVVQDGDVIYFRFNV